MNDNQEVLSIQEVAASFSEGIPDWQKDANLKWLKSVHGVLKEGGVWGSSDLGTTYQRHGDGFILINEER